MLLERKPVGKRVAVIGAGGIGFDVSEYRYIRGGYQPGSRGVLKEWGIDTHLEARGGVAGIKAEPHAPARQVYLLQRKKTKVGDGLGKTTGWIHRTGLKNKRVQMLNSVEYLAIDNDGLRACVSARASRRCWQWTMSSSARVRSRCVSCTTGWSRGQSVHLIGGADVAAELDAKRAINQGSRLAAQL